MYATFFICSLVLGIVQGLIRVLYSITQVQEYRDLASRKSELERTELQKEKEGVFAGCYARNPSNGKTIPIWVADYVLARCVVNNFSFNFLGCKK